MSKLEKKQTSKIRKAMEWGKVFGHVIEDFVAAILGFIPNGLNIVYDFVLKPLPLLGGYFSHRTVESVFKFITGISIAQSLAIDIAHLLFWPLGFFIGCLMGIFIAQKPVPSYQGKIGKCLHRVSGQSVGGMLAATLFYLAIHPFLSVFHRHPVTIEEIGCVAFAGGLLGLVAKWIYLLAVDAVNTANAAAVRRNVQRAKELGKKLKAMARQKAKCRILTQAQDIIQQMNGAQAQSYLEDFLKERYEEIAKSTYQRLDRHFDYLVDRACHGDLKSLKRLQALVPNQLALKEGQPIPLDKMLERIFNARAVAKIKDEVDTQYDRWFYQFLLTN